MKQLQETYRKLSVQAKSSLWFMITQCLKKGIGFIVVPLYTRLLTAGEYGKYNIFYSWYEVLLVFGTLRLYGNSYVVGMTKFEKDRGRYTSSMLGLGLLCTMIFYLIARLFQRDFIQWLGMSFPMISLLFLEIVMDTPYNLWAQSQKFDYKYKGITTLTMSTILLTPVIGITLAFLMENKALGAILGKCVPAILSGIFCMIVILKDNKTIYVKKYWSYALGFNLPLIFYYLAQVCLNQMDRLMIQFMEGEAKVGIYSVANAASYVFGIVTSVINVSFIPYMFQNIKAHREDKIKLLSNQFLLIVAVLQLILIAIAPEAMKILATPEYQEGVWLIPPLVASVYISFVYQLFINVEFYYEKKFFLMWASIMVCVCNFSLNYWGISRYGYLAAGYTTLISNLVCLITHMFCVKRIIKKANVMQAVSFRFAAFICLLFLGVTSVFMALYPYVIIRYLLIAIICLTAFAKRKLIFQMIHEVKTRK